MQGSWLVWGFCVMFFVPFSFLGDEVLCLSVLIFVIFFSLPFVSLCQIYHMKSGFGSVPFTGLVRLKYNTGYQYQIRKAVLQSGKNIIRILSRIWKTQMYQT